jgi:hypothetical protein
MTLAVCAFLALGLLALAAAGWGEAERDLDLPTADPESSAVATDDLPGFSPELPVPEVDISDHEDHGLSREMSADRWSDPSAA